MSKTKTEAAAPIPIPFSQRLNALRVRFAPVLMFVVCAIIAGKLWQESVAPGSMNGEVVAARSSVNSPAIAYIQSMKVSRFQAVKAGEVLALLAPTDPRRALDLMQGELEMLRMRVSANYSEQDALIAQRRQVFDYEQLRLDLMMQKILLVTATSLARKAAADLEVATSLSGASAGTQRLIQDARMAKDAADSEVKARKELVDALASRVEELSQSAKSNDEQTGTWRKTANDLEKRISTLNAEHTNITLTAPIDGTVTAVLRRTGENVVAGEPLVIITATKPETIVGYMRQPMPFEPEVGQSVEVRTVNRSRAKAAAVVTRIGSAFEPIVNPALHPLPTPEAGLPVEVSIPDGLRLRPGEIVSLVLQSGGKSKQPAF